MCALFVWLGYRHAILPKVLKKLTQVLANVAEERGTDAPEISYIKEGRITIYKRPKPAHKICFNAPDGTTAVMKHTRLTIQGNQKFNQNNHPFYGHGVLYNDSEFQKTKNLPETHIETDGYVAVQLIEQQKKLNFDSLKNMAETVQRNLRFSGRSKTRIATYRCNTIRKICQNKEVNKDYLDVYVVDLLRQKIFNADSLKHLIHNINIYIKQYNKKYDTNYSGVKAECGEIQANPDNITKAVEKGIITESLIVRAEELEQKLR